VDREIDYYEKQSRGLTTLIRVLGTLVAVIMGNRCESLRAQHDVFRRFRRSREIATMRAIGFGAGSIVVSFIFEALFIALVGGLLGSIAILPLNGLTTSALNWQTFSSFGLCFSGYATASRDRDYFRAADGIDWWGSTCDPRCPPPDCSGAPRAVRSFSGHQEPR